MTNRDKINALSNRELADLWNKVKRDECAGNNCVFDACYDCGGDCLKGIEAWLGLECETEENQPADKHVDLQKVSEKVCDNVNHPSHYNHGKIEVIDFIEDQHLGFHLGNAVKYISRAGRKDPARNVEDLRKAAWYLNRQIERLEGSLGGQNG